jgi:hypothetical protein
LHGAAVTAASHARTTFPTKQHRTKRIALARHITPPPLPRLELCLATTELRNIRLSAMAGLAMEQ